MPVRLDEDVVSRIDAVAGHRGRSQFIRDAVSAALSGAPKPDIEKASADVIQTGEPDIRKLTSDQSDLLRNIQSGGRLPRKVAEDLGWLIGRVERRASELEALGLIRYSGGVMEAV